MKINNISIAKVKNKKDFFKFMDELDLKGETFIIKPNWVDANEGAFTEAKVLEYVFEYLKEKKLFVIESHTAWRNRVYAETTAEVPFAKADQLEFDEKTKNWIRKEDDWFLKSKGIKPLLEKYNVKYINVTEEVWAGRTVDADVVRNIVEKKYKPLQFKEFYSYVPKKIFELRGATFISLSKVKTEAKPFIVTSSTKNQFGLIPHPSRWKYHGKNHEFVPQAIVDINKIYRSLFEFAFIVEGIYTAMKDYLINFTPVKNWGYVIGGRNSIEVDAVIALMNDLDYKQSFYFSPAIEAFGGFDESLLKKIPKEFIKPL